MIKYGDEILEMSGLEMSELMRSKKVSCRELIQAHIEHIQRVNPRINAMIACRFDEALKEADQVDGLIAGGTVLSPLQGVPCSVKDTYPVKGLSWVVGSVKRKDQVADFDSAMVRSYKSQGLIVLGKSNVPEAAMWAESFNKVYGLTKNPYNLAYTAGGSSGGEGSIIGSAGVPIGLGSEFGGSIRMPCSFSGIAGHKATGGLTQDLDHWPQAQNERTSSYFSFSPMAKRMEDVIELMKNIPVSRPISDPAAVDPKKLKYFFYDSFSSPSANKNVKENIARVMRGLEANGAEVEEYRPPHLDQAFLIWNTIIHQLGTDFAETIGDGQKASLLQEAIKTMTRSSEMIFPNYVQSVFANFKIWQSDLSQMQKLVEEMKISIDRTLGDRGVLICPPYPTEAPRHFVPCFFPKEFAYSGIYNILELPGTSVRTGSTENGLPLGVQIIGKKFDDHKTLAAGKWLEEIFGGWSRP